jgi:hypothetical protein
LFLLARLTPQSKYSKYVDARALSPLSRNFFANAKKSRTKDLSSKDGRYASVTVHQYVDVWAARCAPEEHAINQEEILEFKAVEDAGMLLFDVA